MLVPNVPFRSAAMQETIDQVGDVVSTSVVENGDATAIKGNNGSTTWWCHGLESLPVVWNFYKSQALWAVKASKQDPCVWCTCDGRHVQCGLAPTAINGTIARSCWSELVCESLWTLSCMSAHLYEFVNNSAVSMINVIKPLCIWVVMGARKSICYPLPTLSRRYTCGTAVNYYLKYKLQKL